MKGKSNKKRWIATATIITIIIVLAVSLNLILGNILHRSINNHLETFNKTSSKEFRVGKITLNIWASTLILKDISITPDSSMFEQFKNGQLKQMSIMEINIPLLKFSKLGVFKLFLRRNFTLNKILLSGVDFTIYKNDLNVTTEETEPNLSLDSIYIKGLKSINLSNIDFEFFSYTTINVNTNDTIFSFRGNDFEISGLELDKIDGSGDFFKLNTEMLSLKMQQQRINLRNANYFISLGKLDFSFNTKAINASNLIIKPTINKYKLGASYKYTKEVLDVEIKSINVFGYKVAKALKLGIIDIDSVLIDGMKVDVYKDRTKPFDKSKRLLLMQQQLKALKQPLHIKKVKVSNGNFTFALRPEGSEKLMKVGISNIKADVDFITSIKDSLQSGKKLQVNLDGILMGASSVNVNVKMPYNSPVDTFYFSGELGSGDFTKFNQALYPVTGIKFNGGRLNSLKFYANASPKAAKGLMTMLYEDLEAEIPKKDTNKKNKFLSFTANTVLRTSNPSKRGKTRVALVKADRVEYKGFGNFLWITVQSGLTNTILPTGKSHKEETQLKKEEKKTSSAKSKKKRRKRKK